jgi:Domain of unknown function (DUF5666)
MNYQDALEKALALADEPQALNVFLSSVPAWRSELELAITVASSVAQRLERITPSDAAAQRSQQQLISVVARLATAEATTSRSPRSGLFGVFALHRFAVAGVAALAIAIVVLTLNLPSLAGAGTPTAEALVIEGNLAEVSPNAMTVSINNSPQTVKLSSDAVLQDGFGNTVEASKLSAGQDVVLEGSRSGNDFVASQVQLRDRLFGVVTALPGDSIHLSSASGDYAIRVTTDTQFEGVLRIGDHILVKLTRMSDGSLVAVEVETEDEGSDNGNDQQGGDGEHESSSPPPASSVPPATQSGSSDGGSQQSKEDDGKTQQIEDNSSSSGSSHESGVSSPESEHEDH